MSSFIITLVRHGQTDWNTDANHRMQGGGSDVDLNENGCAQARQLQEKFKSIPFAAAFSSDLSRAKTTLQIALAGREVKIEHTNLLRERRFGIWEGKPAAEYAAMAKQNPPPSVEKEKFLAHKYDPTIESDAEIYARFSKFVDSIKAANGANILVVAHGGFMRSVLNHIDYKPNIVWTVNNAACLVLKVTQTGISILEKEGITCVENS